MSPILFSFKFCWQIVREHLDSQHHGILSLFLANCEALNNTLNHDTEESLRPVSLNSEKGDVGVKLDYAASSVRNDDLCFNDVECPY